MKDKIRLEIRRLINNLIEEDKDIVIKIINQKINKGADKGAKENLYENANIKNSKGKFNGEFEFETELLEYTVSFKGGLEGIKKTNKTLPPEYNIDVVLESIKINRGNKTNIDFDILSNKKCISETTLLKLEKNISETIKINLD